MDTNIHTLKDKTRISQLRLFQIISPSLPIGGFTYSQGMEWAVECGWLSNADETEQWLHSVLFDSLACLELPVIKRMYEAMGHNAEQQFEYWSHYLLSNRETSELRAEEKQRAWAFNALLSKLPEWDGNEVQGHYANAMLMSQSAAFALAGYRWSIPLSELLTGFAWAWLENGVNAAVKLVPLGQTDGQAILYKLANEIPKAIDIALQLKDDELGASTPALAIASSLHETQYCRLFRS